MTKKRKTQFFTSSNIFPPKHPISIGSYFLLDIFISPFSKGQKRKKEWKKSCPSRNLVEACEWSVDVKNIFERQKPMFCLCLGCVSWYLHSPLPLPLPTTGKARRNAKHYYFEQFLGNQELTAVHRNWLQSVLQWDFFLSPFCRWIWLISSHQLTQKISWASFPRGPSNCLSQTKSARQPFVTYCDDLACEESESCEALTRRNHEFHSKGVAQLAYGHWLHQKL